MSLRHVRNFRLTTLFSLALLLGSANLASAQVGSIVVNIETELVSMNLTGSALVPLGSDPGNTLSGSIDGYHPVLSDVTISESPTFNSTGLTTITMNVDISDPTDIHVNGTLESTFDFYLDLQFNDADPTYDYAPALGSSVSLDAPATPLSVTLSNTFDFAFLDLLLGDPSFGDLGTVTSSSTVKYEFLADINDNAENDVMKLTASSLDFGLDELTFGDIDVLIDEDDLNDFLLGTLTGDLVIDISSTLGITSTSLSFDGLVLDESTDPPFSLSVGGPSSTATAAATPEPSTLLLGMLALASGAALLGRRRSRRS